MTNTVCHEVTGNYEEDLSDVWMQECDPENEHGEICIGIFDVQESGNVFLIGLRLEDRGTTPAYFNREWAINCLGDDTVLRVERCIEKDDDLVSEILAEDHNPDEEYDIRKEEAA